MGRVTRLVGASSAAALIAALAAAGSQAPAAATAARPAVPMRAAAPASPEARMALSRPLAERPARSSPHLGAAKLHAVRAREAVLAARNRIAPRFRADVAVTSFTVNTTVDSGLANPNGTTCVDAANGKCSLRAAVEAGDNRRTAVAVYLPAGTYVLTTATALDDTDPGGLSITGPGASSTTIKGDGSGILDVAPASKAPSAVLFLTGLTLTDGHDTDGGALDLSYSSSGARAVLTHDVLSGNTATGKGGAVYAGDYDSLFITDSKVTGNHSADGAAIYEYWSYLDLVGDSMDSNSTIAGADGYGGAIYSDYGVVDVTRGSISGNTAGDAANPGYGGVADDSYTDYSLNGVTVNGNKATDGGDGGVFDLYFDNLDITGGSVSHNSVTGTDGSGGAIYIDEGAQVGLHGVTMTGDKVGATVGYAEGGGTIYDYAYDYGNAIVIDSGTTITGSDGSAIYLYSYYGGASLKVANSTLSDNTDNNENASYADSSSDLSGCGGAICAYSYSYGASTIGLTGDKLDGNSSTGYFAAGALGAYNGEYSSTSMRLDDDTFDRNVATGEYSSGAVIGESYYYSTTSFEASGSSFADNSAPTYGYGGAVDVFNYDGEYSPSSVDLSEDHFTDNVVGSSGKEGYGGALLVYYYATLSDQGSTFTGNRVRGKDGLGGAIDDESYQSASLSGTVLTGNSATGVSSEGGAIYTNDYSGGDYRSVTISGNSAEYGGGVYSGSDGYVQRFVDSTISGNTAFASGSSPGEGGGLYVDDAVLTMTNSTISGNTASSAGSKAGEGGGVLEGGSAADFVYSTISANSAGLGGGIYEDGTGGSLLASIVASNGTHNCAATNAAAHLTSLGENVLGTTSCVVSVQTGDKVTSHPGLKPLASNGGPTKTMALSASSPAINRGGFDCASTDQRGEPRATTSCDAGAYQWAPAGITGISPSRGTGGQSVIISGRGFSFALTVLFAAEKAHFRVVSDSEIVATVPRGSPAGRVSVKVLSPDGRSSVGAFTYTN